MSSSARRRAAAGAALVVVALAGGALSAPATGTGRVPGHLVAIRQAAPVAAQLLDPTPAPTPGVPAAAVTVEHSVDAARTGDAAAAAAAAARRRALAAAPVGRVVALTFDDGPDSRWTPQVLALLARYHAHATFCVIGRQVRTREWLIRAVVAQGHTLCNHSWSHDERLGTRSPAVIDSELARTDAAIERSWRTAPVRWFRAPGGAWTPPLTAAVARAGQAPLDWTVDPRDWDHRSAAEIVHAVLAGLRPGAVVDLHDGGGDRSQTVAALTVLLPALAARGYTCVAVTPALAARTL